MAWSTPDSSVFSDPQDCRTIAIPGGLWFFVQGAVEELTKTYNWQEEGTATPEETTQFFMGVLDQFTQSECVQQMQFVTTNFIQIINESYTQSGNVFPIVRTMLPLAAENSVALLAFVKSKHNVANANIQLNQKSGNAMQLLSFATANVDNRVTTIIPMDLDGAEIRSLSANGTLVELTVNVIGWWG